jgi:ribonuclease PH
MRTMPGRRSTACSRSSGCEGRPLADARGSVLNGRTKNKEEIEHCEAVPDASPRHYSVPGAGCTRFDYRWSNFVFFTSEHRLNMRSIGVVPALRSDGRKPNQLRATKITSNYLVTAEGSVLVESGNTRVLCAATVEDSVPGFLRGRGRGWVTAEYAMLPRATITRTPREITKGRPSGRTHEIQRLIGRSLRAIVDLTALSERSVIVDCDVLQADGGTRTAAITGAYVALAIALGTLVKFKVVSRSPLIDSVAATSVGLVGGVPMLDLVYEEDSRADVDMNVVMTGSNKFVEIQATAEHTPFEDAQLDQLLELARSGIAELRPLQEQALAASRNQA